MNLDLIGSKVSFTLDYLTGTRNTIIQKAFLEENIAYGIIVEESNGYYNVDIYDKSGNRIVYGTIVYNYEVLIEEKEDYTMDLVMHNILVGLNKLEKKINKQLKNKSDGNVSITEV